MANQTSNPVKVERNAHLLLTGSLVAAFLIAGTVTKNERAVFLTEGTGLPAKAFVATIPAQQLAGAERAFAGQFVSPSGLSNRGPGRRSLPRRGTGQPGSAVEPGSVIEPTGLLPQDSESGIAQAEPFSSGPSQLASLAPAQFAPNIPQSNAGGGGGSPISGGTTDPVTGSDPVVTPTDPATPAPPVVVTPTDPAAPVAAVPEPSTWAMLLIGFFAIGVALRKKGASAPLFASDKSA